MAIRARLLEQIGEIQEEFDYASFASISAPEEMDELYVAKVFEAASDEIVRLTEERDLVGEAVDILKRRLKKSDAPAEAVQNYMTKVSPLSARAAYADALMAALTSYQGKEGK